MVAVGELTSGMQGSYDALRAKVITFCFEKTIHNPQELVRKDTLLADLVEMGTALHEHTETEELETKLQGIKLEMAGLEDRRHVDHDARNKYNVLLADKKVLGSIVLNRYMPIGDEVAA